MSARPEPRPPVEARPRQLSVTDIERWMRDPYAIYARHILKLHALKPIDADPDQANYGTLIHDTLDRFVGSHDQGKLPADALDRLIALGREAFAPLDARPSVKAFWWPRFERIAHWFIAQETTRRDHIALAHTELTGRLVVEGPAGPFTLTARADRIDLLQSGGLEIIDYKTGAVPSDKDIEAGFSPQLPLEAAIARAGGFKGLDRAPIDALSYWQMTGGRPPGRVRIVKPNTMDLADAALVGLTGLVAKFDEPTTPYYSQPRPDYAPKYSDYEHLARVLEWSGSADDGT